MPPFTTFACCMSAFLFAHMFCVWLHLKHQQKAMTGLRFLITLQRVYIKFQLKAEMLCSTVCNDHFYPRYPNGDEVLNCLNLQCCACWNTLGKMSVHFPVRSAGVVCGSCSTVNSKTICPRTQHIFYNYSQVQLFLSNIFDFETTESLGKNKNKHTEQCRGSVRSPEPHQDVTV